MLIKAAYGNDNFSIFIQIKYLVFLAYYYFRNTVEGKKSFIPKPCYSSKKDRASSCDRDGMGSSVKKEQAQGGLRRSRSFLDLNRNSTPCQTPTQFNRRNTAGSTYRLIIFIATPLSTFNLYFIKILL